MFKWFKNAEVTVETILSSWTKTIKDLEELAESKLVEAAKHNALATFYQEAEALAQKEIAKAKDVAAKVKAIFE